MALLSPHSMLQQQPSLLVSRCKNCGHEHASFLREDFNNEVRECRACGAIEYIVQVSQSLEQIYSREYFYGKEYVDYSSYTSSHRRNFRRKIDLLRRHGSLSRPLRVLEVGAATGEFYQVITNYPDIQLQAYLGLEISEYARLEANARGIRVMAPMTREAQEALSELRPNLIVAWDLWEHLEDPVSIFDTLLDAADDGITVAISTVDFGAFVPQRRGRKWRQYHPPTHLSYPTRESFRRYFSSRGFEISYLASFGSYRPLAEYLKIVNLPFTSKLPRCIREFPVYLNTFDTQLVIATKEKQL